MAERKSFLEIVLMPLVVATLGVMGTYFLTQQQEKNALAKADADRQVKILEIFATKITSHDERERILGLRLLEAIEPELAAKLANAVAESEPEKSRVQEVAYDVASLAKAKARLEPRIYIQVKDDQGRSRAKVISEFLKRAGYAVPGVERVGTKAPPKSQLRYFRQSEQADAEKIKNILGRMGETVEVTYIENFENSSLREKHFELWLAE